MGLARAVVVVGIVVAAVGGIAGLEAERMVVQQEGWILRMGWWIAELQAMQSVKLGIEDQACQFEKPSSLMLGTDSSPGPLA